MLRKAEIATMHDPQLRPPMQQPPIPEKKPVANDYSGNTKSRHNLDDFLASVEHQAYRMAYYALWDHELALDTVQDAMLKLVEHYSKKPGTEWPLLFFTILNNRINDARRRRRVRAGVNKIVSLFGVHQTEEQETEVDLSETASFIEAASIENAASHHEQPEQALLRRRQRAAIDNAMKTLAPRQRQVFLLREWQEMSIKETAQVLGCSEGAVKQHHFRALQNLRGLLTEVWNYD